MRGDLGLREEGWVGAKQHPCSGEFAAVFILAARDAAAFHLTVLPEKSNFRFEIDMLIRDVKRENTAGSEVTLVEIDGLCRQQVQWNGIS